MLVLKLQVSRFGADTPIGAGATIFNNGDVVGGGAEFQGIVATSFVGDGLNLQTQDLH